MHGSPHTVPFIPGELFSTWLVRAALENGCDPLVWSGAIWPGWRAWIRDLDRGLQPLRLSQLSTALKLDTFELEQATLRPICKLVNGQLKTHASIWPWVLAQGSRNRNRHGGLQYCPRCLAEDERPHFRISWRLAWTVGCPKHGCLLHDVCRACGLPAEPHRSVATDRLLVFCPRCHSDLRSFTTSEADDEARAFQRLADTVVASGRASWGNEVVTRQEWFATARRLVAQPSRFMARTTGVTLDPRGTHLTFEMLRAIERQPRLAHAWRAITTDLNHPAAMKALAEVRARKGSGLQPSLPVHREARSRRISVPRSDDLVARDWARLRRKFRMLMP